VFVWVGVFCCGCGVVGFGFGVFGVVVVGCFGVGLCVVGGLLCLCGGVCLCGFLCCVVVLVGCVLVV
jgi:hypothetical protein